MNAKAAKAAKTTERVVGILAALLLTAAPCAAQEWFVGVAAVGSFQAEGERITQAGPLVPKQGIGGNGFGIGLLGGVDFTPLPGVGVEVTVPSRFDGVQETARFHEEIAFRDVILSPMLRVRAPRVVLMAGISWVVESKLVRAADRTFGSPTLGPLSAPFPERRDTFAYSGGVDVPIGITSRIQIVPQLRLHWVNRATVGSGSGMLGLSPKVFRPAIALVVKSGR